jgi:hypothetical protein
MANPPRQRTILLVHSHYGAPPELFARAAESGFGTIVRDRDLTRAHFDAAFGLITTTHLDQLGFLSWSEAVQDLLGRGGRWFFNGHVLRELIPGLKIYVPIVRARRADLVLTGLNAHPIFAGIDPRSFEENKGVAGFYGRGHNPLPEGALGITGVGPDKVPLDWEWSLPTGGKMFSHAGNDVGAMGGANLAHDRVAPRVIAWTLGELN